MAVRLHNRSNRAIVTCTISVPCTRKDVIDKRMKHSERQLSKEAPWTDLVIAVGVIAMVLGHALFPSIKTDHPASTLYIVIYWWHMPLFFIMGGLTLKPLARNWRAMWQFVRERLLPMASTYLIAGVLLIFASHVIHGDSWGFTAHYFLRLIYGGSALNGDLTMMWFFTVMALTFLVVELLITWTDTFTQFFIAITMFALGISYGSVGFMGEPTTPWAADLVLMTTLWMLCGYHGYRYYSQLKNKAFFATAISIIFVILAICRFEWGLNFVLYLKTHTIKTPYMAFYVPLMVALALCIMAEALYKKGWLNWLRPLSWYAVPILYMHQAVIDVLAMVPALNHTLILWLLGVIISLLIAAGWHHLVKLVFPKLTRN